jgi:hypothetical protein
VLSVVVAAAAAFFILTGGELGGVPSRKWLEFG